LAADAPWARPYRNFAFRVPYDRDRVTICDLKLGLRRPNGRRSPRNDFGRKGSFQHEKTEVSDSISIYASVKMANI
jgi:hypothetical protein